MDQPSRNAAIRRTMQRLLSQKNKNWRPIDIEMLSNQAARLLEDAVATDQLPPLRETEAPEVPTRLTSSEPKAQPNSLNPHWILWFSEKIVIGIFVAGARLMQAVSFKLMVLLVFTYLIVLLCQILIEPRFRLQRWIRPLGIVACVGLCILFWLGFVKAADPLIIETHNNTGEYQPGTVLSGIKWRPEFADIRVDFDNQTNNEYNQLDIDLGVDSFIAGAAIDTPTPSCAVDSNPGHHGLTLTLTDKKTGKKTIVPQENTAPMATQIKLTCDKLRPHTDVALIIAAASSPMTLDGHLTPGGSSDDLYGPKPNVTHLYVEGTFESLGGRPRKISLSEYAIKRD